MGRPTGFFRGDWSWNIFYGRSPPSADSRRTVVKFLRKNVHNTGKPLRGLSLPSKRVVSSTWPHWIDWAVKPQHKLKLFKWNIHTYLIQISKKFDINLLSADFNITVFTLSIMVHTPQLLIKLVLKFEQVQFTTHCAKNCWMSGKQCRPWWDATFCGISSGSTLFAQASLSVYLWYMGCMLMDDIYSEYKQKQNTF